MKKLYAALSVSVLSIVFTLNVNAQSGGNGSFGNPYQIKNCDDLQAMELHKGSYWILMNDVDCAATKIGGGQWGSKGFRSVGDSVGRFHGSLNGNCYSVNNLFINNPSKNHVGLFGYTDSSANIHDIAILNCDITGNNFTGAAIGCKRSTTLDDCVTTGKVTGDNYTGGVVGLSTNYQGTQAQITNCSSEAAVKGYNLTGGVVGKITTFQGGGSYLTNCYSTGNVTGNNSTGGVAGYCGTYQGGGAQLQYCYSSGTITGKDSTGGLVGNMGPYQGGGSTIIQSYFIGSVSGRNDVGGLAGFNGPNSGGGSSIYNSYSQGNVTGTKNVGGLVGYEVATGAGYGIDTCYSSGIVSGTTNIGGLVGDQSNTPVFATNYWDSTLTPLLLSVGNLGNVAGIKPSSTGQMQTQATYLNWNFLNIWTIAPLNFPALFPSPSGGSCNFPTTLTAAFDFTPDSTCALDTVYFTDRTLDSPTGWKWDFGDPLSGPNNTSLLQNPKHAFTGIGTYTVKLVASKGPSKDSITSPVIIYCGPLALNKLSAQADVTVYPNPGNGLFNFVTENPKTNLEVYNVLGETVYKSLLTQGVSQVDIKNQAKGVYFYKASTIEGALISTGKLVVQ